MVIGDVKSQSNSLQDFAIAQKDKVIEVTT
jgi:hypothetical protein